MTGEPHGQEGHQGHPGAHGPHGVHGHQRAASLGLTAATGTITSIGEGIFVIASDQGEPTVATGADTNFHGLSRNEAREMGYPEDEVAVINTFAGLKVGQQVGVIGKRQDDTLVARGVHFPIPPRFGAP